MRVIGSACCASAPDDELPLDASNQPREPFHMLRAVMSEYNEIRPFIRISLSPRENFQGYILRLSTENELKSTILPTIFWKCERRSRTDAIRMLCTWTASTPENIKPLFVRHGRRAQGRRAWAPVPGYALCRSMIHPHARVCPACLAHDGIADSAWSLRLYIGCSEHRTKLAEFCPSCGKALLWNRRGIRTCVCGYDLAEIRTPRLPDDQVELMSMIRSACSLFAARTATPRTPAELALPDLLKMIMLVSLDNACYWELGLWNCKRNANELVRKAAKALTNWPHGIRTLLRRVLRGRADKTIRTAPAHGGRLIQAIKSRRQAGLQWKGRAMVVKEAQIAVNGHYFSRLKLMSSYP